MKLRDVLKALDSLKAFDSITFNDYGMSPETYLLSDLMKYVDSEEEVMNAWVTRFETRNNTVTLYGFFKEYVKEN